MGRGGGAGRLRLDHRRWTPLGDAVEGEPLGAHRQQTPVAGGGPAREGGAVAGRARAVVAMGGSGLGVGLRINPSPRSPPPPRGRLIVRCPCAPTLLLATLLASGAGCAGGGTAPSLPLLPPAATLLAHPEAYHDHAFAFAGEIVAVVATQGITYLEVELLALDPHGQIDWPPHPTGRAFVRGPVVADPGRYLPGRGVVGSVRFAEVATGVVGDERHPYPLLDLLDHRVVSHPFPPRRPRFHLLLEGGVGL
ncbi:MAG: hypothetical protein COZ96_01940 [Nitrospirae bacterium CG_4_8_14_3_um_filter_70_85]|nr:MAG: hypothetical protein COS73_01565 [Nitrospirae bacterium CG06_land_8_20_14_3_00_70_43]PIW83712.1 MAG: hypothetical protein COZ96_01940 [Nitrospirae bacterium CG_4_8_14_3_um_filter_70_85]